MKYYSFGPTHSEKVLVGTPELNKNFSVDYHAIIASADEDQAIQLSVSSIGERVGTPSFSFSEDHISEWLQPVNPRNGNKYYQTVCLFSQLQALLGSISLDGYTAVLNDQNKIVEFFIKTSEGDKVRIAASKADKNGSFDALPAEFQLTAYWLAKIIIDQY